MAGLTKTVSGDRDVAIDSDMAPGEVVSLSDTESNVLGKINRHLLPLMLVSYIFQYFDKVTLGYAAIMGIQEDTHLVGQDYSLVSSAFYWGYLAACYPASLGFVKFPVGKYLAATIVLWGAILAVHAAATNFGGLMALRILLGAMESVVSPGFTLLTAMFWKRSEHAFVHGIWYSGTGIASFFGGLATYGIAHIDSSIAPWQWLFIIFGISTVLWGLVLLLFLPDSPGTAKFLTLSEREAAQARIGTQHSSNSGVYKMEHIKEAFFDLKAWLMCLYVFLVSVPGGALSNFSSIIISGFGFTTFQTILVNMPPAVIVVILGIGGSYIAGKFRRSRCIILIVYLLNALIGVLLIRFLPTSNRIGRLFGVYLFNSTGATFPIILSLIASNITGYTKKTVVNAMFFVAYCVGNIVAPLTFKSSEAPSYTSAYLTLIICLCLGVAVAFALRLIMDFDNKRRDSKYGARDPYQPPEDSSAVAGPDNIHFDATDKEAERTFRYMV